MDTLPFYSILREAWYPQAKTANAGEPFWADFRIPKAVIPLLTDEKLNQYNSLAIAIQVYLHGNPRLLGPVILRGVELFIFQGVVCKCG
jgi:hypothetical protein